jgi:hypothetical protein
MLAVLIVAVIAWLGEKGTGVNTGEKGTGVITVPRITNSRIWAFRNSTRPLWL